MPFSSKLAILGHFLGCELLGNKLPSFLLHPLLH